MTEILSTKDFVARLLEDAELITVLDPTTATDPRVIEALERIARAVETKRWDGVHLHQSNTGEHAALREPGSVEPTPEDIANQVANDRPKGLIR